MGYFSTSHGWLCRHCACRHCPRPGNVCLPVGALGAGQGGSGRCLETRGHKAPGAQPQPGDPTTASSALTRLVPSAHMSRHQRGSPMLGRHGPSHKAHTHPEAGPAPAPCRLSAFPSATHLFAFSFRFALLVAVLGRHSRRVSLLPLFLLPLLLGVFGSTWNRAAPASYPGGALSVCLTRPSHNHESVTRISIILLPGADARKFVQE